MARAFMMAIAVACYGAFFVSFLYLVGWIGAFDFMPTHVDKGVAAAPITAIIVDAALIALFGVQHTVMARQSFKKAWTKVVPAPIERSIFCLATAVVLAVMFRFWHPLEGTVWMVGNEAGRMALRALFWAGWAIVFISTWLVNHFELFGLQQAWLNLRGREAAPPTMRTPLFYKLVRHPIYAGFLIAFWATPHMTYSHLLAAIGFTIYIMIGITHEEKDLLAMFGEEYAEYRRKVGAVIPGIGKKA